MSWKNKVYRARDRRYLQRRRGEEERTDEDESGGWFRSVSGCVGWFAVREMEGLRHARARGGKVSRGDGLGSKGDRLPPSQGRGKLSPGSRGDLFRESSSFLSGIWFWGGTEERTLGDGTIECIILWFIIRAVFERPSRIRSQPPSPTSPDRRLTAPNLPAFLAESLSYLFARREASLGNNRIV